MAWRYCDECGGGQDRITLEEIDLAGDMPIRCARCDGERGDDTPRERTSILAAEIIAMKAALDQKS